MGTRIQALFPKISFEVYHRTEVIKVEPADKIDARVILFTGFHRDVYLFCLKPESDMLKGQILDTEKRVGNTSPEVAEFQVKELGFGAQKPFGCDGNIGPKIEDRKRGRDGFGCGGQGTAPRIVDRQIEADRQDKRPGAEARSRRSSWKKE